MADKIDDKPTLEEMTTEQPHNTDPEYIAAVNRGIAEAQQELKDGKGIPEEEFWKAFGLDT
ncbi:MAG: hypothetical protein AAFV45_15065 [Pseudomonadota bacterium]